MVIQMKFFKFWLFDPEDGGRMLHQNDSNYLSTEAASLFRRLDSSLLTGSWFSVTFCRIISNYEGC